MTVTSSFKRVVLLSLLLGAFVGRATVNARPTCGNKSGLRHHGDPCEDNVDTSTTVLPLATAPPSSSAGSSTTVPTKSPTVSTPSPTDSPVAPTSSPIATTSAPVSTAEIPTLAPTPTFQGTSPAPTVNENCTTNEAGFFGTIGDDSTEPLLIEFGYELETSNAAGNVQNETIPALERAFNEKIIPSLFADICASSTFSPSLVAIGVSTRPDDLILPGVNCAEPNNNAANECNVVEGGLIVYVEGIVTEEETIVLEALQQAMTDGEFVDPDAGIERVTFVDIDTYTPIQVKGDEGVEARSADSDRNNGLLYGLVAGLGTALIVVVGFTWRRRQKRSDDSVTQLTPQV